ncbi:MAG: CBS domain-containing protein [Cyclobacteriaceae bacterium]|nr:CBS domain-containing protein [Cyclobacteriaceae bacterium]
MGLVKNLLEYKGNEVYMIHAGETIYSALMMLAKHDVGALVVVDECEKIVGIFSERDYARKVVLMGKSSKSATVKEMMNPTVYFMKPDNKLLECLELMTKKRTRHLPILQDKKMIGLVSIGDIVNRIISEQKTKIKDLEGYIVGDAYGIEIKMPATE